MIELGDPLPIQSITVRDATGAPANAGSMTLTVTLENGTTATPGFSNPSPGVYVPGVYETVQPGRHWARWKGTGVNEAAFEQAFYVHTLLSAVPWRPTLREVASLTPNRTISQDAAAGDPVLGGTFTAATVPAAVDVEAWIDDAVAEIAGQTGDVDPSLYEMARSCAKQRTAAKVQTAVPEDTGGGSGTRAAEAWRAASDACVKALVAANAAQGGDAGQPGILGEWAFPDPVVYGSGPAGDPLTGDSYIW
jgi:hypothetical protein